MAHNINFHNGSYSFVSKEKTAWHGLGKVYDHALTTKEALEGANLDYEVQKVPNYIQGRFGDKFEQVKSFSTIRTDNWEVLGSGLGSGYTVFQNVEALSFFDDLVIEGEGIIETAGALGAGEVVFISAKLPDHITVKDDVIDQYLLITNSHDGSSSITVMFTPIRVVCNNTLNFALKSKNANKVKVRHTLNASSRVADAKRILGIQNAYAREMEEALNYLAKKTMTTSEFDEFLFSLLRSSEQGTDDFSTRKMNIANDIRHYYFSGVGQHTPDSLGSRYGALNAVTGYFQNMKSFTSDEAKAKAILTGNARTIGQKAFNALLK